MAVSLDVSNAFNSLPRPAIHRALGKHGSRGGTLRGMIGGYLSERSVTYTVSDEGTTRTKVGARRPARIGGGIAGVESGVRRGTENTESERRDGRRLRGRHAGSGHR